MRRGAWFAIVMALGLGGCATPLVQPRMESMNPPRIEATRVIAADGAVLPLSAWPPAQGCRAVVLALHGFNDYRRAFESVGPFLAERGIAVYAYDQRGFGAAPRPGIWPGSTQLVGDVAMVASLLRARHPGCPLYLLGESMGGAVALSALAETAIADGAVLVAPAVWGRSVMNPLPRAALWLAAHTWPGLRLSGQGLGIIASDNEPMLRALHEDPLVIKETRVDALWGLSNLMDRAFASAPRPGVPILMLYGARDEIIPRRPTCRFLATAGDDVRFVLYPAGYHMLTRDLGAAEVLADIAAWLADADAHLPSGYDTDGRHRLCGTHRGGVPHRVSGQLR
ncbi:MAG TPA: alpha/beta hydrolase [Thiobacillaceae bacterium]|nr:alpha/beta hydrolase [Thiobacillaceae bacterium]